MGKSLNILGDCLIGIFVKFGAWIQNARETKQAKLATFTLSALHVLYSLSKHMVASTHNISNIINLFFQTKNRKRKYHSKVFADRNTCQTFRLD